MLPLPWWILGTAPEEELESDDDSDYETVDGVPAQECPHDSQESVLETPVSVFRTPSASPFIDVPDHLPKVVEFSTFLNVAKRRSSSRVENTTPKIRRTEKRNSLIRSETEVMNKSADGQSILDSDEPFGVRFLSEAASGSPMPFSDAFNQTFNLCDEDGSDEVQIVEKSAVESPNSREYPLFFTSFDDTTVIFNTAISGDIDLNAKSNDVGDWVFKSSEFVHENKPFDQTIDPNGSSGDIVFKEPAKNDKTPTKKARGRPRAVSVRSGKAMSSRRTAPAAKKNKEKAKEKEKLLNETHDVIDLEEIEGPSRLNITAPTLTRRHTPSRKAKNLKSYRE
uniref:Shugoshin_C domain-containing protein n=1 Tax=Caenorhabditis tropicalis TaxID=1561998 RepID=A0A1I7SXY3_9PELO